MIGRTIGHYRIIEKLGEGGMGAVYMAEDTTLNRLVALKTLTGHLTEDAVAQERFVREAQSTSSLNHPNITTIYEFLEEDDARFICMEYVEGMTIKNMIEQGTVSVSKAIDIIIQAAEALDAAHRKGILHRDVKSANIMVNMDDRVKMMDFGLVHLEDRSQLTRTGTMMGTISYVSPEQVSGQPVDRRSDLFSLGVVLHEMVTGKLPFQGTSEAEILYAIINNAPPSPSIIRDDMPEQVESIISKMLEKDPEQRYQSCAKLVADLKGALHSMVTSTASSIGKSGRNAANRRRVVSRRVAAGIAAVAVVTGGIMLISGGDSKIDPNQVVVAPFRNLAGIAELDYMGDTAAWIINRGIERIATINPVPAEDAIRAWDFIQAQDDPTDLNSNPTEALANTFSAGTVITGTYQIVGESILFSAEVTDVENGIPLDSIGPVSAPVDSPMTGIEHLTQRIMGFFASAEDDRVHITSSPSVEAWREFNRGFTLYLESDVEFYGQAIEALYRASQLDTTFAPSLIYAGLCLHNLNRVSSANRQSELDSVVSVLRSRRGQLSEYENCWLDYLAAVSPIEQNYREHQYEAMRQAAKLAPGSKAVFNHGLAAYRTNRLEESAAVYESLDPENPIMRFYSFLSWKCETYHLLGEHRRELVTARQGKELFPDAMRGWLYSYHEACALAALGRINDLMITIDTYQPNAPVDRRTPADLMCSAARALVVHGHNYEAARELLARAIQWCINHQQGEENPYPQSLARALYASEQWEAARAIFEALAMDDPGNATYQGYLGTLAARRGDQQGARRISDWLEEDSTSSTRAARTSWRARIAAQLGNKEEAVELLREAFSWGLGYLSIHGDMDFEPLLDYPPYQDLIRPKR
ncbi:protein kinase [Candidatus Zixiibacteriota bacterium]